MDEIGKYLAENYIQVISISVSVLALIGAIIKAFKVRNSTGLISIFKQIPALVTKAEEMFGKGKGPAKLAYVLSELRIFALENKVKVTNEDLTAHIDNVVKTTNTVNTDKPTPSVETKTAGQLNFDEVNKIVTKNN